MTEAGMLSYWRTLVNELNTTVVPDATAILYVQAGLETLNSRTGYYQVDDNGTVILVSGTQEYTVPADLVRPIWLEYGGRLLVKSSMDAWRIQNERWREVNPATPEEWAFYGRKFIFFPKPNVAGAVTVRYVATPPTITGAATAPAGLGSQDHRTPCYYGAGLWCQSANSPISRQAPGFFDLFEKEAERLGQDMGLREVLK